MTNWPKRGDQVKIIRGRHLGKIGTVVAFDIIASGQQRMYPVVTCYHDGEHVRVLHSSLIPYPPEEDSDASA